MRLPISPSASLMLIAPLALIASVASNQVAIAQSEPAHTHDHDYEHFYIGVDSFDVRVNPALSRSCDETRNTSLLVRMPA